MTDDCEHPPPAAAHATGARAGGHWSALEFSVLMTWYVHAVTGRASPYSQPACTAVVDPWHRHSASR